MFALPDSARDVRDTVRAFVDQKVEPVANEIEETGRIPQHLLDSGAELGLFGLGISERFGGSGENLLTTAVAVEALSHGPGAVTMVMGPSAPAAAIGLSGSADQKDRYLPDLAAGRKIASFSLTESEAGSDAAAIRTRAVRDGDDWVISGTKLYISRAGLAELFLVSAVTDPALGRDGITVFLVDRSPRVRVGKEDVQLGLRGSSSAEVFFDDVRVGPEQVLGTVGKGFEVLKQTLTRARLWAAARSTGAMAACLDLTLTHVGQRVQFGHPLGEFQAVKLKLADMAVDLAAARHLLYSSAQTLDEGGDGIQETSVAKLFATEAAGRVADMAVQLHGAMGVSREYPVERFYRDVRAYRILDGASDIQRLVIASGLRRRGAGRSLVPGAIGDH